MVRSIGGGSSQILQFMIILSTKIVHTMYMMKRVGRYQWKLEKKHTHTHNTKRHKIQIVSFKNGNYNINDNIIIQSGYRIGYILTKLGQLSFMPFTRIA